jgi:hypothetical protein
MSSQAPVFSPVIASGIRPPEEPIVGSEALVLGPWVIRRAGAAGPGGALISRRENFVEPTLILARRRRTP